MKQLYDRKITITITAHESSMKMFLENPTLKALVRSFESQRMSIGQDTPRETRKDNLCETRKNIPRGTSKLKGKNNLYRAQMDFILGRLELTIEELSHKSGIHRMTLYRYRYGGCRTSSIEDKMFETLKSLGATEEEISKLRLAP